jgi:hypothetical protein
VNNNLYSQILLIQQEFNAKQNSTEIALIPHVRTYKHTMLKLTCAAEIKRQDSGLPLAIFAQAFPRTSEEQKKVI